MKPAAAALRLIGSDESVVAAAAVTELKNNGCLHVLYTLERAEIIG